MKILILLYYFTLISVTPLTTIESTNLQQYLGLLSISLSMIDLKTEIEKLGFFKKLNIRIEDTSKQRKNSFPTEKVIDVRNLAIETSDEKHISLFEAAHLGNDDAVRRLIALNVNVNAVSKYGATALLIASQEGHDKVVDLLLENNADIEFRLTNGMNALMLAAKDGNKRTVEVLFKYGVNINAKNDLNISALELAVFYNHKELVELFVKSYNSEIELQILQTSLTMASMNGNSEIVQILLPYIKDVESVKNGLLLAYSKHHHSVLNVYFKMCDVNTIEFDGISLLCYASYQGDDVNVQILLRNKANVNKVSSIKGVVGTPLFFAVRYGHVSTIKLLLKHEASINYVSEQGLTALFCALLNGKDIVKLLLQHKAEVNIRDKNRYTALHMSVYHGWIEIVEILLKFGADVNALSFGGHSALMIAAFKGFDAILELLLQYKVDIHAKDRFNHNALMFACQAGRYRIVQILLKHGARVNDKSTFGFTPLIISEVYGHEDIEDLLLENGASAETSLDFSSSNLASLQQFAKETINKLGNTPSLKNEKQELNILSSVLDNVVEEYFTNNEDTFGQINNAYKITDYTLSTKGSLFIKTIKENVLCFVCITMIVGIIISVYFFRKHNENLPITRESIIPCYDQFFGLLKCYWSTLVQITRQPLVLEYYHKSSHNVSPWFERIQESDVKMYLEGTNTGAPDLDLRISKDLSPHQMTDALIFNCIILSYTDCLIEIIGEHRLSRKNKVSTDIKDLIDVLEAVSSTLTRFQALLPWSVSQWLNKINEKIPELQSKVNNMSCIRLDDKQLAEFNFRENLIVYDVDILCCVLGLDTKFSEFSKQVDVDIWLHDVQSSHVLNWFKRNSEVTPQTEESNVKHMTKAVSLKQELLSLGFTTLKAASIADDIPEDWINHQSALDLATSHILDMFQCHPVLTETSGFPYNNTVIGVLFQQTVKFDDGETVSDRGIHMINVSDFNKDDARTTFQKFIKECKVHAEEEVVKLYHGSSHADVVSILTEGVILSEGRPRQDFSHNDGFYLSYIFNHAKKRAMYKSRRPAVIVYSIARSTLQQFTELCLDDNIVEWRKVIKYCRKGYRRPHPERFYDFHYITGPMCKNPEGVSKRNEEPETHEDVRKQMCIKSAKLAEVFNIPDSIICVIFYDETIQ